MSTVHIRFSAQGPEVPQRSPLLERLLARASPAVRTADWRAAAFRAVSGAQSLPSIAGTALAAVGGGGVAGGWGCIATPVHCIAGMTAVAMHADGRLTLNDAQAAVLAADFNRVFAGAGVRLVVGPAAVLICVFDRALEVATHDPEAVAGGDVFGFQPAGRDAPRLRRLMTEMEMWLFEHEINRAREAGGLRPITGLWLWGEGAAAPALPTLQGWTAGRDPFFAAFGDQAHFPAVAGAGVVVCDDHPGSLTWPDFERRWLAPAVEALRSRRIRRLDLGAGRLCRSVVGGFHWRLWRRPVPWWESFDERH